MREIVRNSDVTPSRCSGRKKVACYFEMEQAKDWEKFEEGRVGTVICRFYEYALGDVVMEKCIFRMQK
jgi:hypothetical protein